MARLVVLVLLLCFATPAAAGLYEDAATAYTRGDYQMALRILQPMAEQGDADAQFNLALMYSKGNGVPQNNAEAVKWYQKAADQGDAAAQFNLASM